MRELIVFGPVKDTVQVVDEINNSEKEKMWNIIGIVDENISIKGTKWHDIPYVGSWEWLEEYHGERNVHCCIGKTNERKRICEKLFVMGYTFPNLINPRAVISKYAQIGEGNLICADVQIHPDSLIGNNNFINVGVHVGHDVIIGNYCNINTHVKLVDKCEIKDLAYLGAGSTIIKESKVGMNSTIGAMSLVNNDIPDEETWVGIPAKPISKSGVK